MTQPQADEQVQEELGLLVLASLTAWLALVFPAVMAPVALGGFPNLSMILAFEQFWNRQVDTWMPVLARLARRGWADGNSQLGLHIPYDPNSGELVDLLARTRNLLVRIPQETYQQVLKSLARGRDLGESNAQLIQRIDNVLNINGSENWPNRSKVIARTELHRFESAGVLGLGYAAQRERRTIMKRWQDREDDRVRRAHARVDNQLRRLGEPFEVGASLLQHPVDPSGRPEDVINCRCRLELVEV